MQAITQADREAAHVLREMLADISGFWHRNDDDSPLCQALARHRSEAEKRLAGKLAPFVTVASPAERDPVEGRGVSPSQPEMISLPRFHGPVRAETHRGLKS